MTRKRTPPRQKPASTDGADAFRLLFRNHPVPMWVYDLETLAFLEVNETAVIRYGYSRDEFLSMTIRDIRPKEDLPRLLDIVAAAPEGLQDSGEWRHTLKDGRVIDVRITSHKLLFGGRGAKLVIAADVTERKRAEAQLRESEERFRATFEQAAVGIAHVSLDGRWLRVNQRLCDIVGYAREELLVLSFQDVTHPDDVEQDLDAARQLLAGGTPTYSVEKRYLRKSGGIVWANVTVALVRKGPGEPDYFIFVVEDVSDRKRAEEGQREGALRLRLAVQAADIGLWDWDLRTDKVHYSPDWKRQIGYQDDEISDDFDQWRSRLHPEDLNRALETVQACRSGAEPSYEVEFRFRHKDGSYRHILGRGSKLLGGDGTPIRLLGSHVDITERAELQAQFLQSQKMESVGRLAGGVAHDFNNLLTVINGHADLALERLKAGDPLRADLQEIRRAGDRAASLTGQLLAFSRRQIMNPDVLNLNTVVAGMQAMLGRLIGEDVELAFVPAKGLGNVRADPGQIEQVVMNLAVNARDAMPNGGTLTIETRDVELDEAYGAAHPSVQPGSHVMLAIRDTGAGMDEATSARIFEPFFTTKDLGKGTGLGLSTVYGIIKQSGGSIWVSSELGKGTTFEIYLPRVEEVAQKDQTPRAVTALRGTETVLVVEDEDGVRYLARRALQSAGYTVLTASKGEEALELLERHGGPVHVMLTDVVMPGMSGRDLAARLADIRPLMKVLYTSGYTDDAVLRHGVLDKTTHFIAKPYTIAELTRKIRDVIDS